MRYDKSRPDYNGLHAHSGRPIDIDVEHNTRVKLLLLFKAEERRLQLFDTIRLFFLSSEGAKQLTKYR